MKKLILIVLMSFLTCASIQASPNFIELQALQKTGDSTVYAGSWSSQAISSGKTVSGVFFWADAGRHGTFGSSIWPLAVPTAGIEFYYNFQLGGSPADLKLIGTVMTIRVIDSESIVSGYRKTLDQIIEVNEPVEFDVGRPPDSKHIIMQVTIRDHKPVRETICGPNQLKLVSTGYHNGKTRINHEAGRELTDEIKPIETSFGSPAVNGISHLMKYEVEIEFSPAVAEIGAPAFTTLTFNRKYAIDTLHYSGSEENYQVRFRSTQTREITLASGRILKIVIPADTPSVHGFMIVDTLIIHPGPLPD